MASLVVVNGSVWNKGGRRTYSRLFLGVVETQEGVCRYQLMVLMQVLTMLPMGC